MESKYSLDLSCSLTFTVVFTPVSKAIWQEWVVNRKTVYND